MTTATGRTTSAVSGSNSTLPMPTTWEIHNSRGGESMRLSCCAYSYRKALQGGTMTLPDFMKTCREIGFDGVELTAYYFPTTDRASLNQIKLLAHQEGLAISGTAIGRSEEHTSELQSRLH